MEPLKESKAYAASHHSSLLMKDLVMAGFRLKLCKTDRKKSFILITKLSSKYLT